MPRWLPYLLTAVVVASFASTPDYALDLNSFRAQHGRPALHVSVSLSALAYEQAHAMASRKQIDHKDFRKRIGSAIGATHAENVSYGCADEDCAIRQWARSAGHRNNMLRGDVSGYGIASATGQRGRRYWALELGGE
jgi:uncharacterized protein YkwD